MKWIVVLGVAVVALAALLAVAGAMLPRAHVARRSLRLHRAAPADVWSLVSDFAAAPSWRSDVSRVERGADRDGHPVWIEHGANGAIAAEVREATPPRRLVTEIVDSSMFGGSWTWDISREGDATRLTITENGWVSNPIFRLLSKFVFGHYAGIDAYLKNVAKKFSEDAELSGE